MDKSVRIAEIKEEQELLQAELEELQGDDKYTGQRYLLYGIMQSHKGEKFQIQDIFSIWPQEILKRTRDQIHAMMGEMTKMWDQWNQQDPEARRPAIKVERIQGQGSFYSWNLR